MLAPRLFWSNTKHHPHLRRSMVLVPQRHLSYCEEDIFIGQACVLARNHKYFSRKLFSLFFLLSLYIIIQRFFFHRCKKCLNLKLA